MHIYININNIIRMWTIACRGHVHGDADHTKWRMLSPVCEFNRFLGNYAPFIRDIWCGQIWYVHQWGAGIILCTCVLPMRDTLHCNVVSYWLDACTKWSPENVPRNRTSTRWRPPQTFQTGHTPLIEFAQSDTCLACERILGGIVVLRI